MKTPYGEINSIYDFFQDVPNSEVVLNPTRDKELQIIHKTKECKICNGKIIVDIGLIGAGSGDPMLRHIELHKTINQIFPPTISVVKEAEYYDQPQPPIEIKI